MFTEEEKKILKTCISTEIIEVKRLINEKPDIELNCYLQKLMQLKEKLNKMNESK